MIHHSKKRITITMPKDMLEVLEALSDVLGRSKSDVILKAIDTFIQSINELIAKEQIKD